MGGGCWHLVAWDHIPCLTSTPTSQRTLKVEDIFRGHEGCCAVWGPGDVRAGGVA